MGASPASGIVARLSLNLFERLGSAGPAKCLDLAVFHPRAAKNPQILAILAILALLAIVSRRK